ncbi:MAG: hypothetical protein HQK77_16875 [Desulfobacterales bacterium]|nr:hypothetical protein [Desulfobacterales bacterium]
MKQVLLFITAIAIVMFGFHLQVNAEDSSVSVPQLINYQGKLTDASGNPLKSEKYKLTFSIYKQLSDVTPVWGPEAHPEVPIVNGFFNVILGSIVQNISNAFANGNAYLEIKVGDNPAIKPRQLILSVPYAMQAENAKNSKNAEYAQQLI